MAKKKPARPARPAKSAEPTTAQLRKEYYARRAAEQALEELGLRLEEREPPKGDAQWWASTRDALDRLEILHAVWRFTGLAGYAPEPEDFDPDRGWPTADEVEAVFGSWDKMLDESGIDDAIFGVIVEKALSAHEKLAAREKELELRAGKLEEEGKKIPELKRREEVARAKRDEADGARATRRGRARRGGPRARSGGGAGRRAGEPRSRRCAPRRRRRRRTGGRGNRVVGGDGAHARRTPPRPSRRATSCTTHMERLRAEREQDRRTIAELTQLLARVDTGAEDCGCA